VAAVAAHDAPDVHEAKARRAIRGAFFGFFVDMFDIYLPVVVLAPAIKYFVSPQLSDGATSLVTGAIFAATLVGRPVGALIFGHFADRLGRKRATLVSVSGFGILTIVIGCLPGYSSWGVAAVVLFIALRFIVGVFVGGEYTSASPLAMEYSKKDERGPNSARIMLGFPLAYFTISGLTLLVLQFAPSGDPTSAYSVWGWRIPFFVGGTLALGFVMWFARQVEESELFQEEGGNDDAPVKQLVSREVIGHFAQVFVLMTGFWLSLNTVTAILPGLLKDPIGLSATSASLVLMLAALVNAAGYLAVGHLAQRFGRRPFLMAWGISAAVVGTFVYWLLLHFQPSAIVTVTVLVAAVTALVNPCWAMITAYINERFATGIRASGFGLGYSLAVVIPSFYAFYQGLLGHVMSSTYTALPLLVIGGLLITIGGAMGPETRDVDLGDVYEAGRSTDAPQAEREPRFTREGVGTGAREREGATVTMSREERLR
jgi:MFS family permease